MGLVFKQLKNEKFGNMLGFGYKWTKDPTLARGPLWLQLYTAHRLTMMMVC